LFCPEAKSEEEIAATKQKMIGHQTCPHYISHQHDGELADPQYVLGVHYLLREQ
jgi:hypothetical protein